VNKLLTIGKFLPRFMAICGLGGIYNFISYESCHMQRLSVLLCNQFQKIRTMDGYSYTLWFERKSELESRGFI
jgi:isocitrate lyase